MQILKGLGRQWRVQSSEWLERRSWVPLAFLYVRQALVFVSVAMKGLTLRGGSGQARAICGIAAGKGLSGGEKERAERAAMFTKDDSTSFTECQYKSESTILGKAQKCSQREPFGYLQSRSLPAFFLSDRLPTSRNLSSNPALVKKFAGKFGLYRHVS